MHNRLDMRYGFKRRRISRDRGQKPHDEARAIRVNNNRLLDALHGRLHAQPQNQTVLRGQLA